MQTKLLLIDFDGTLVDTRQANYRAYRDVLGEIGIELDEELYLSNYYGMRCVEFLRTMGVSDEVEVDRLRRRKIELYPTHFDSLRLNGWLHDMIVAFKRDGGKAWIVSTGQLANISNAMEHLGVDKGLFDGMITSADVTNSKPAPDPFLMAMEREGCTPAQSLIFEDSVVGIAAAEASGAPYVKVVL